MDLAVYEIYVLAPPQMKLGKAVLLFDIRLKSDRYHKLKLDVAMNIFLNIYVFCDRTQDF